MRTFLIIAPDGCLLSEAAGVAEDSGSGQFFLMGKELAEARYEVGIATTLTLAGLHAIVFSQGEQPGFPATA